MKVSEIRYEGWVACVKGTPTPATNDSGQILLLSEPPFMTTDEDREKYDVMPATLIVRRER